MLQTNLQLAKPSVNSEKQNQVQYISSNANKLRLGFVCVAFWVGAFGTVTGVDGGLAA